MENRSKKSIRNIISGIGGKIFVLVFAFIARTSFVRILGADFNGINGLFTNILSVLCLADLGIDNVLNYALYDALKDGNRQKLCKIINSFKRVYNLIAIAILVMGLVIMIFFRWIINSPISMQTVVICYFLYLTNTVASYLFVYRTTIISADQNQYVVNLYSTIGRVVMYVVQIIYLQFFRDIYGYLVIQIVATIIQNILLNIYTSRHYEFLTTDRKSVDKLSDLNLSKDIKATFVYKFSSLLINNTDNIIISTILGTTLVGYYSNYFMLIQYVEGFIYTIGTGLVASIGNLNAENDSNRSYRLFTNLNFIYGVLACFVTCCFMTCVQDFILIWLGKSYVLNNNILIAMVVLYYLNISVSPIWMFRETMGIFQQVKYIMLFAAVLNIIFSIFAGFVWGLVGIIGATSVSKLLTQFWYEPKVLYKVKFNKNVSLYFLEQGKNLICTVLAVILSVFVCKRIVFGGILHLLLNVLVCGLITFLFETLFNVFGQDYRDAFNRLKSLVYKNV
jgi:O-antigen/teichoic acid export membrane protein